MTGLEERIRKEYEYFRLDLMRTSRENIFAHAHEIESKKRITESICRKVGQSEVSGEDARKLEGIHNILDAVFCYYESERTCGSGATPEEAFGRWMETWNNRHREMGKPVYPVRKKLNAGQGFGERMGTRVQE